MPENTATTPRDLWDGSPAQKCRRSCACPLPEDCSDLTREQVEAEIVKRETAGIPLRPVIRLRVDSGSEGATVRCKRCGGTPVVAEVEGRTLVCATCRDDAEFRAHAREDYR